MTSVGEFTPESGDLRFKNGDLQFDIYWTPTRLYQQYYKKDSTYSSEPIELLGQAGTIFHSLGTSDYTVMLPPKGKNYITLRAELGSEQAYRDVLAKVKQVGVNTWLSALPQDTVRPNDTRKVVTEMLADIQVPPGFDKTPLYKEHLIDRYQLGVRVTGAVSCAWLDRWFAARKAGDSAKQKQAVTAMQGSHHWKILLEMNAAGDYPEEVWGWADSMAQNLTFTQEGYRSGLIC